LRLHVKVGDGLAEDLAPGSNRIAFMKLLRRKAKVAHEELFVAARTSDGVMP
jgi:hypothetical protein